MTGTNQFWCFRWQPCQTFIENHLKYEWKCVFSVEWMCVCVLNKTPFPFGTVSILYWAEIMSKPCIKVTQYSQQKNSKQNCDVEHGKQMLSHHTQNSSDADVLLMHTMLPQNYAGNMCQFCVIIFGGILFLVKRMWATEKHCHSHNVFVGKFMLIWIFHQKTFIRIRIGFSLA